MSHQAQLLLDAANKAVLEGDNASARILMDLLEREMKREMERAARK